MGKNRKHDSAFRLSVIKLYLKGASFNGLSQQFKITKHLIQKWVKGYQIRGAASLRPQYGRVYTKEFKLQVVIAFQAQGLSLNECCLRYGIPSLSTLSTWVRQYKQSGIDGFSNARGRPITMTKKTTFKKTYGPLTRLEELEKENLYLRAENEVLKKLKALAQQEQQEAAQRKKH